MGQPRTHSQGNIPFSWERKPGVPKVTTAESFRREHKFVHKLQPPPYTSNFQRNSVDVFQIPLPPCAFQPPFYRTSSRRCLWVQNKDPFLAAFKECTKNHQKSSATVNKKLIKDGIESRVRKSMSFFSCTRSCTVHDTNLVRISHLDKD